MKFFKYYPSRVKTRSGGETYKKRTESTLLTECLGLLEIYKNSGLIVWYDRLNSGKIFTQNPYSHKVYKIQLCKAGTPDAYFITNSGRMVWIETKLSSDIIPAQNKFREMVSKFDNHFHLVIDDAEKLRLCLEGLKINK